MDIPPSKSSDEQDEQADGAWVHPFDDNMDPVSWPADLLWPSNNYSSLWNSTERSSAPFAAANMRTWVSPSSITVPALRCYYPPLLAPVPPQEVLKQTWAGVVQSHERDTISELTEGMATPGHCDFRLYNTTGSNEQPADPPMKVPGGGFSEYITQSHGNEQNLFFNSQLQDPVRGTYVIQNSDVEMTSHNMHMETHQDSLSPEQYGHFEEHRLQVHYQSTPWSRESPTS
ncbi:hypothetical protein DFP73DRAFT_317663 [Morchella snyderi]|nr:hypothetical protein DFP73DRAFT_317663 [Morchella snyderi]